MTFWSSLRLLRRLAPVLGLSLALVACGNPDQNTYSSSEVAQSTEVTFGTVVSARKVRIKGDGGTAGLLGGAAVGGLAGSQFGGGKSNTWLTVGGAVAGALAGSAAQGALSNRDGVEYTITLTNGRTITTVQEVDGEIFSPGAAVMVQKRGGTQRVLSAANLPSQIARPKDIKIVH